MTAVPPISSGELSTPAKIADAVTPAEVSTYTQEEVERWVRVQEASDRSFRMRTVVQAWEKQQAEERKLRKGYGWALLIAVFAQAVAMNVWFVLLGTKILGVDQWVATVFIAAVFSEIAAMVLVIVKYLFPPAGAELLKIIEKL